MCFGTCVHTGSEASLIKSGLTSTSSSVGASKRTLTSHDGVLDAAESEPTPSLPLPPAAQPQSGTEDLGMTAAEARTRPSYLRASRCVGGYSTFTSYASTDRRTAADDHTVAPHETTSTDKVVGDGAPRVLEVTTMASEVPRVVSEVPKGGQQCRLTLVDDMIADVKTLSNGSGVVVNGEDFVHHHHPVSEDAIDGHVQSSQVSAATDVKVPVYA